MQYTIDFNGVKTYFEFYECLIKSFDFPQWCGKNPDAIWDLLTERIKTPSYIYIKGINSIPKSLEEESILILKILKRTVSWYESIGQIVSIEILD